MIRFENDPFGIQVAIVRQDDEIPELLNGEKRVILYAINRTKDFIVPGVASTFRFLANAAPKALKPIRTIGEPTVEPGDVLHFEAIAELSRGAKRIGVLKADVDRLGLVMSEGLNEDDKSKEQNELLRPTLARVASLSRMLDLFFSGNLNRICQEVFESWKETSRHKNLNDVDDIFYVMYSGGDDLFIVGPWDQTLELALRIQQDFSAFTGGNSNMTLSAGYIQVKSHYPAQKFAELVSDIESQAKMQGRNRFAAFGEVMLWTEQDVDHAQDTSFEWLKQEAERWIEGIESMQLPSGLIYDLGGLFRQHRTKDGKLQPMWTPRLYYTLARRLKPDALKDQEDPFQKSIFKIIASGKTLVPVSIASLSIRERSK
jgi:CRISPR-associated protein Csm1